MKTNITLIIFCLIFYFDLGEINQCFGQKENNIWYFGCDAGISFNVSPPAAISGGTFCTNEGSSSICNAAGQLLFYTDGANVWNRNNEIMPNGSGLSGGWTSTQAALIVKMPGFIDTYYIFTTANEAQPAGLRYSVVNMSLDCGYGDVSAVKDSLIVTPVSEKVTAIQHENGKDYWIITQIYGTNKFHSYLLTSSGFDINPVITSIGSVVDYGHYTGYLKGSNKGDKIAAAYGNGVIDDPLQLFDFDNTTGILSNVISLTNIDDPDYANYGVEFSPNDRFLYVSGNTPIQSNIYQYDLQAGSPELITSSRIIIKTFTATEGPGALQLAPDGKIYLAIWDRDSLAVIEQPDSLGLLSSFVKNGIYLGGNHSLGGLPAKPNVLNYPSFNASNLCFGVTTYFSISSISEIDSVSWNFDDPNSGSENYSILMNPDHQFSESGMFNVELIVYSNSIVDTVRNVVEIRQRKDNQILGSDTTLCIGQTLTLEVESECGNIHWQDGSNNAQYQVIESGEYSVMVIANGCMARDTIVVNFAQFPVLDLGNDTTLCSGESLNLGPIVGVPHYWQDNSNDPIYTVTSPGLYYVIVSKDHCTISDSILVKFRNCDHEPFSLPNVFTPNGDGMNDVFNAQLPNSLDFIELSIFNRWGEEVFRTTDLQIKWDGSNLSEGVFFWILSYRTNAGEHYSKSGSLQLLR